MRGAFSKQTLRRLSWLGWRLLWLAGLVSHGFWFLRGLDGATGTWASQGLLGLSLILFALKTVDVPFLRVRWTRRSLTAVAVIIVLLHVGVIQDAFTADADIQAALLPIESTFLGLARWLLLIATLGVSLLALSALAFNEETWRRRARDATAGFSLRSMVRILRDTPLRAPPSC